jgi:hypothetical protein
MKNIDRLLIFCAASMLASAPNLCAAAQPSSCKDDRGIDRCADESRTQQRLLYKVASTEDFANRRVQLVRAFFVDGYGQDMALVTFRRAPGEDLQVEVRLPDRGQSFANPPLFGPLSGLAWTEIMAGAGTFDRDLVPLPKRDAELSICLHSWVSTVEVVDENGRIRRKTSSACGGDSLVRPMRSN